MKTNANRFADFSNEKPKRPYANRLKQFDRAGYTLLEILVSVTLMLVLMFCVAKLFSRVGSIINDTQRTMEVANNIRNVRNRLEADLTSLTAPLTPPLNSSDNQGYFCYIEGLGNPLPKAGQEIIAGGSGVYTTEEIALDGDRSAGDSTVGDLDDILMFTAQAPAGNYFRGRFGGKMIESEFAEIVWFVRGSTLYRRVLLIVPDQLLQERIQYFIQYLISNNLIDRAATLQTGQAFFKYFDVSVHLDDNGYIVANTLGDLSNRKNRYGYWSSYFGSSSGNISGTNGAWYWLRLPTLWESASSKFQAGVPMGSQLDIGLTTEVNNNIVNAINLPNGTPFIDYWTNPNCWNEVDNETGNLTDLTDFKQEGLNQDVIMTNVLSFNVRVWDPNYTLFQDLGIQTQFDGNIVPQNIGNPNYLDTPGYYADLDLQNPPVFSTGNNYSPEIRPFAPCIYDTWTEQYQKEFFNAVLNGNSFNVSSNYSINDIPLNGKINPEVLDVFPPPYNVPLKGLQIEIRAFEPRSRTIKNTTLEVDIKQ
ncbi:MAG: hypothetical protein Q4C95_12410 [Planctomycetia bacterium]|nr:hypothetical protein [Planctomycetia bacterium]